MFLHRLLLSCALCGFLTKPILCRKNKVTTLVWLFYYFFKIILLLLLFICFVFDSGFQKWTNKGNSSWLKQASWKFCNETEDFNCTYFIVIPGIHNALALSKADSHYQKEYNPVYPESMRKRWQHCFLYKLCTERFFFKSSALILFIFIFGWSSCPYFLINLRCRKKFGLLRSW